MNDESEIKNFLKANPVTGRFIPYCYLNRSADALTVVFAADRDYTTQLTDAIAVSISLETNQVIGCRLEGITSILDDLQNYVPVNRDSIPLQLLFFAYGGGVDDTTRQALVTLAWLAALHKMTLAI